MPLKTRGRRTLPSDPSDLDQETLDEVERLARFADENPNPILRATAAGDITYANEESDRLLRFWETDIDGRLPAHFCELTRETHESGTERKVEEVCEDMVFEISLVPVAYESAVHLYCVDITERKKAEARIFDLAQFPHESPEPILRVDAEGMILYANARSAALLAHWSSGVGGHLPEALVERVRVALKQNVSLCAEEICAQRSYSLEFTPVQPAGYLNLYARDITEQRRAERRIIRARDEALEAQEKLTKALVSLERRNDELAATTQLLDEEAAQHQAGQEALAELEALHLSPLLARLRQDLPTSPAVLEVCEALDRTIARLGQLVAGQEARANAANKKVLLAEGNAKRRSLGRVALRGLGLELDIAESHEQGLSFIEHAHYDVICCSEEMLPLSVRANEAGAADCFVLMTHRSIDEALPILIEHEFLTSLVARYDDSRSTTLRNIATTVQKLATTDFFGVHKYLDWGAEVSEIRVFSSEKRDEAIARMDQSLRNAGIRPSQRNRTAMIAEELLMNAIYDAPQIPGHGPRYNHLPRTTPLELTPAEACTLRWGFDGSHLVVSVEDPFGALSRDVVLSYLEGCYGGRAGTLNEELEEKAGAGMGLFQIMRAANLMVINCHSGSRTEVIAILDLENPNRQTNGSLHFFFR